MTINRINYLDGHRGIAILLVMAFHAFCRWTEIVPYTNQFAEFPLFKFGFLGVQLFFILSGFVILMTLDKCQNFQGFLYQRWLRLFPAMLICSLIIFLSAGFFFERPQGAVVAKDLIPGLTFIEPYYLSKLIGSVRSIEGAFWSLYVEFKFYIISACIYFIWGSKKLVYILFILFFIWFFSYLLQKNTDNHLVYFIYSLSTHLSLKFFGWFAAGASFYTYTKTKKRRWFFYAILMCFVSSIGLAIEKNNIEVFFAVLFISTFFSISIINAKTQRILSNKFLLFLGYISYPLYLLHENMMISITIKLSHLVPMNYSFILPIISILFVSSLAYFIACYIEKPIKKSIENIFKLRDGNSSKKYS
jgi:peptidoglycan/LPS O-acetylase OafA/YrhL